MIKAWASVWGSLPGVMDLMVASVWGSLPGVMDLVVDAERSMT